MTDKFDGEASEAAARYARAAFDLAKEAKALDAVEQDFAKLAAAWKESAELRAVARSPLIQPQEKAAALTAVAAKLGISDLGAKLIGVVATNRRAAELPAIASAYRVLVARERGAQDALLDEDGARRSATAVDDARDDTRAPQTLDLTRPVLGARLNLEGNLLASHGRAV